LRGIAPDQAANFMIDGFWSGAGADWDGTAGNNPLAGRITVGDGNGDSVLPGSDNMFSIVAGTTDLGALLKNSPVMIRGPQGQSPTHWLLATGLTDDGKGAERFEFSGSRLVKNSFGKNRARGVASTKKQDVINTIRH
jgi:hypothetical protein